jgi:hypothetical protein
VQPRQFAAATRRVLIPYTTVWALKARPSVVSSRGFKKMKFVSEQRCLAFSMGTVMGGKDCKKWFPTLAILSTKAINLSPLSVDESTRKLRSATPDLPTDTSSLESPQETSRYRVAEAGVSLVYLGIGDNTRALAFENVSLTREFRTATAANWSGSAICSSSSRASQDTSNRRATHVCIQDGARNARGSAAACPRTTVHPRTAACSQGQQYGQF